MIEERAGINYERECEKIDDIQKRKHTKENRQREAENDGEKSKRNKREGIKTEHLKGD